MWFILLDPCHVGPLIGGAMGGQMSQGVKDFMYHRGGLYLHYLRP